MIYITENDLTADSFEQFINESSDDIEDTLDKNEARAIDLVKTYMSARYDVETIFSTPIRNEVLVDVISKITLYKIFRRNAPRKVSTNVKEDYDWALKMLEKIEAGRPILPLPLITTQPTSSASIWGNNRQNDYYI